MKVQNRWIHLFVILLVTVLLVSACGSTTNGATGSGSGSSSNSQSNNAPEQYPDVKSFVDGFCLGAVNPGASGAADPYKNMSYMYRETHSSGELEGDFLNIWDAPFGGKIAAVATTYNIASIAPPTVQNGLQVYQVGIVWGVPDLSNEFQNVSETMLVAKWDDTFIVVSLDGTLPQQLPDPATNPDQYPAESQLISDYCYNLSPVFNPQAIYSQQMSAAYQASHSPDDFNALLSQNLQSINDDVIGCDLGAVAKSTNGGEVATMLVSSPDPGSKTKEIVVIQTIHLIQEDGAWKIDSIE